MAPILKDPMEFERWDFCPNCGRNRVELFSFFNSPMHYAKMVDAFIRGEHIQDYFKYAAYMMRCTACGKCYDIVWDGNFPMPMKKGDYRKQNFIKQYQSYKKEGVGH
ncbi:hypothetical protein [uncultured Duncaniella sp.]|uniref:hypothetical protein n=1 Tax=uncultured Duncaniella sp. TaxID=2768039 RepID=UPI00262CD43B|nr:hypothetical protein [uncultured Duncaniella sp.]